MIFNSGKIKALPTNGGLVIAFFHETVGDRFRKSCSITGLSLNVKSGGTSPKRFIGMIWRGQFH
jgi:hypothetical protein